jgi:hypothetical protein
MVVENEILIIQRLHLLVAVGGITEVHQVEIDLHHMAQGVEVLL